MPHLQELAVVQIPPDKLHNLGSGLKDAPDMVVVHNAIQVSLSVSCLLQIARCLVSAGSRASLIFENIKVWVPAEGASVCSFSVVRQAQHALLLQMPNMTPPDIPDTDTLATDTQILQKRMLNDNVQQRK